MLPIIYRVVRIILTCHSESASSQYVGGRNIEPADSPQNMDLVRNWLKTCQKNHPACWQYLGGAEVLSEPLRTLPTRVIDLGESDGADHCRLFQTGGAIGQYISLSHRWGSNSSFHSVKLTKDKLEGYCRAVPYSTLPRTFKDAFKVCQNLKIRYIWIDALCIVQDDDADWKREAVSMGDIFEGSVCTIAAVDSLDTQGETDRGLFMPRCRPRISIELPCLKDTNMEQDIFLENIHPRFESAVMDSLWSGRGWVFQEKALSRRVVYYTKDQLFWTCTEACHDEQNTEHDYLSPRKAVWHLGSIISEHKVSPGTELSEASPQATEKALWDSPRSNKFKDILENYSRSKFTHWSDKTVAINSMLSRVEKQSGISFRAGISTATTAQDLLWEPFKPHPSDFYIHHSSERTSQKQHLPSWSWLSHNGPISYRQTLQTNAKDPEILASFNIVEDALRQDDGIGSIRATLELQAPTHLFQCVNLWDSSSSWDLPSEEDMKPITSQLPTEHQGEVSHLIQDIETSPKCMSLLKYSAGESIGWYIPDSGSCSAAGDTALCCALATTVMAFYKHQRTKRNLKWFETVECIVVRKMSDVEGSDYRRIGRARIFGTDWLEKATTQSLKVF